MRIPNANPDLCMDCVVAVSMGHDTTKKAVEYIYGRRYDEIASKSKGAVGLAIEAAQELNLVAVSGDSLYDFSLSLKAPLRFTNLTDAVKRAIFRKHLQKYEPYARFHALIALGNSSDLAARRTSLYFERHPILEGEHNTLAKWGIYAGTLEKSKEGVVLSPSIQAESVIEMTESLKSFLGSLDTEMASNTFVQTFLGPKTYDFLSAGIQSDLSNAMVLAVSKPEEAIRCMGRALEDYLKLIADARNVVLEDGNGNPIVSIGPMIGKLRKERILAKSHGSALRGLEVLVNQDLFLGLSAWRNMPAHGTDAEADVRWSLSTEVALVGVFQLLLSIRSTHHYLVENKLSY